MIIKDYETFHQEIEELQQENMRLRKQLEEASKRPAQQFKQQEQPILIF